MPLAVGTRLGPYEIQSPLGVGGMGEVYRARDTTLNRDVALKVLPELFALDPDRLARFKREAQVLASLNHPNIAAIYGFEATDGVQALVLELVEGPTLADRIARSAIPLDEALPIAKQIAEALEAAHEHGIIHRDLKPANIKVRDDGTVKVLDFGLAKALQGDVAAADVSQSPTLSVAATRMGVILGTAAYMSPEQAKGRAADKRSDIWAFGCVLFEMLTGRHAFAGETITDILVSVMTKDPDWQQLPPATPLRLRQLLTRSLRKDVRTRLQHAGDARIEIVDILAEPSLAGEPRAAGTRPRHTAVTFALTAVATAALAGFVVWSIVHPRELAVPAVTRVPFALPHDQRLVAPQGLEDSPGRYPAVALSQDGSKLAYAASAAAGVPQLHLRELDAWEARPLPGTEDAELPFFSPDGTWIGFLADGAVFKMPSSGGARMKIGTLPLGARGAAWGPNETMILGGVNTGFTLDAGGGEPRQITRPDSARGEQYHAWPDVLPGGTHVLFTAVTGESSSIGVLSLETGEWHILEHTEGAAQPRYLDSGHLVFFRAAGLFATRFDPSTTEPAGSPVQVVADVFTGWNAGLNIGYFAVSRSGSLVYVPGGVAAGQNRLVLVDRQGREAGLPAEPGRYGYTPSVSPDGQRLAVSTNSPRASSDLWVHDLARGTRIRLTSQGANILPVWTADGRRVIFSLFMPGAASFDLYSIAADGSGKPEPLLVRDFDQSPTSSSRDGRFVAFDESHAKTGEDIHVVSLDGDHAAVPFLATSADEQEATFSPDGRFVAYSSNESGRFEVYVQRFPGGGGRFAISSNGGRWPHWSPKGDELFYRQGSAMMAVIVADESTFRAGTPRALFEGRYAEWYDVTVDGGRFVMITKEQATLTGLNLVLNWVEELKRLVPSAR